MSESVAFRISRRALAAVATTSLLAVAMQGPVQAAPSVPSAPPSAVAGFTSQQWLQRWQQASARESYAGTLALSGERGNLRSARVWHAVRDGRQIERVDNLAGAPRSIFRTDQAVHVFLREQKLLRIRTNMPRQALLFPGMVPLPAAQQADAARYYRAAYQGQERVANHLADIVQFAPVDGLRYAYRFWSEQKTGLLLKWQMLQPGTTSREMAVLREVAFSDLQIQAPLSYPLIEGMMKETAGYQVRQTALRLTSLQQQGWAWRKAPTGYFVTHCYLRSAAGMAQGAEGEARAGLAASAAEHSADVTQCVLSDGLSSISLFLRDAPGSAVQGQRSRGATQIRSQSIEGYGVTAVGEVPLAALQQVLDGLQRRAN